MRLETVPVLTNRLVNTSVEIILCELKDRQKLIKIQYDLPLSCVGIMVLSKSLKGNSFTL